MYQGGGNLKNPDKVLALCCYSPVCWELRSFYLVPFCRSLYYTFTQGVYDVHFVGLANFRELLGNPVFLQAVGNTLRFLALGVPLLLSLALLVSVIGVKAKLYMATLGPAVADGYPGLQPVCGLAGTVG